MIFLPWFARVFTNVAVSTKYVPKKLRQFFASLVIPQLMVVCYLFIVMPDSVTSEILFLECHANLTKVTYMVPRLGTLFKN